MPKLTIDGKAVEAAAGTNLIEAARLAGAEVPHFCYHPGLSVAGNCRMCLVEIAGSPKLQIACNTPVAEGQVVLTDSPKVKAARAGVMEFLLLNHPIDCPVCDCAGECFLQDHYMKHDLANSRLEEAKNKKLKAQDIGPHVMLDTERCVLCTRCVRFTSEVSKSFELGIFGRGSRESIGLVEGTRLENPYSGNVVDICPVGALTDKQFRFKSRPWFLESTETLCNGCSKGCNIILDINPNPFNKVGTERAYRITPKANPAVNGHWICDEGRYAYPAIDKGRAGEPSLAGLRATPERAVQTLAGLIKDTDPKTLGILLSPSLTLEELWAWRWLAKALKASVGAGLDLSTRGNADGFLIQEDRSPNRASAELLGLGCLSGSALLASMRQGQASLIVVGSSSLALEPGDAKGLLALISTHALPGLDGVAVQMPLAVSAEQSGVFINHAGRAQRLNQALAPIHSAQPAWSWAQRLALALGLDPPFSPEPGSVLAAAAEEVPALKGIDHASLGDQGLVLNALAAGEGK